MIIRLGHFDKGEEVLDKTFTQVGNDTTVIIKENTSENTPTFIISGKSLDDFRNINAVYMPKTGRYYNVTDKEIDTGKRVNLVCEVDSGYTFLADIKNSNQMVARNQYLVDNELADSLFPIYEKESVECRNFGRVDNAYSIVMLTTGANDGTEIEGSELNDGE